MVHCSEVVCFYFFLSSCSLTELWMGYSLGMSKGCKSRFYKIMRNTNRLSLSNNRLREQKLKPQIKGKLNTHQKIKKGDTTDTSVLKSVQKCVSSA